MNPEELIEAIRKAASGGRIPCEKARALAKELHVPLKEVGSACTQQGIKITSCELGCF